MSEQDLWSLTGTGIGYLTVGAVGVFAGSMLTEAGILVPYWRSLDADTLASLQRRKRSVHSAPGRHGTGRARR